MLSEKFSFVYRPAISVKWSYIYHNSLRLGMQIMSDLNMQISSVCITKVHNLYKCE